MTKDLKQYLEATYFLDFQCEEMTLFGENICSLCSSPTEKAVALYYAVRDQILYDPYDLVYSQKAMRASTVLQKKQGYCVSKAVLLAALGRQQGIASRIGFADVTNHLSSPKLREKMGTDLFIYHGYSEMFLENKWVKATPAFNLSLCTRFNVMPLEFDGTEDSIFHEFNSLGQKHMEYVKDHGHFSDLPFEQIFSAYKNTYPSFFEEFIDKQSPQFDADFAERP